MARPPFDMQRACYWLIAVMIAGAVVVMMATGAGCGYLVLTGRYEPGVCISAGVTAQLREMFSEVLTAVLALLLAARGGPPPPPDKGDDKT